MAQDKYSALWISHSRINDFKTCPRAYFLKYIYRNPKNGHKIKYTYKLEQGISEVKGGINVLTEMNYPKEIIDNTILQSKEM